MAGRRPLLAIIVLASVLHVLGIARSMLPAQDGLKFIRVARAFQTQPWTDVVRGSDQHPLYPALVAMIEPVISAAIGRGPDAWRVTAQLVSALASITLLIPLHSLTKTLFNLRIADLAALGFVLLPVPMAVGHDTLSDPLALCAFVTALRLGLSALKDAGWRSAIGCGLVAGLGFLARPEVLVVPVAVAVTGLSRAFVNMPSFRLAAPRVATLVVVFLVIVGSYALVKGEVSEKLAVRYATGAETPKPKAIRAAKRWLPPGLDDPRWDFAPKEEPAESTRRRVGEVAGDLTFQWAEMLGWLPVLFTVWGLVRDRYIRGVIARDGTPADVDNTGRRLMAIYLVLFALILVRHELRMGYLSGRHLLTLVIVSLPWAAAGAFVCARGFALKAGLGPRMRLCASLVLLATNLAVSCVLQSKPAHASRWGHWAAGKWLAAHANGGESVLDTRGWAAFVSERPAYDYWHVRQAFSDASLAYVVVGDDELNAKSRRAETLRAVLAFAGTPVAGFPELREGNKVGVWVYRFERPASWEGLPTLTMRYGTLWQRLVRGTRWMWLDERYRDALPSDLGETVMALDARDRLHAKQGRSTARVVFHGPGGPVPVYLKRHYRLPWPSRLAALVSPGGKHTPGSAEFAHLSRARAIGVDVPEVVAAGERIGPWGELQSFLMVAELTGCDALNEAMPALRARLDPDVFESLKRKLAREAAVITATLHAAYLFHKDLYLCHFYVHPGEVRDPRLSLIDLHRLGEHRWLADRWRWKDLGQLLFSSLDVEGLNTRDALRFWVHYQRRLNLARPRRHLRMVVWKAARYLKHNRDATGTGG